MWAPPLVFYSLTNFHKRLASFFFSPSNLTPPSFFLPFTHLSTFLLPPFLCSCSFCPSVPSNPSLYCVVIVSGQLGIRCVFACFITHLPTPHFEMNDALSVHCDLEKELEMHFSAWCSTDAAHLYVYAVELPWCDINLKLYLYSYCAIPMRRQFCTHLGLKNMHFQWTGNSLYKNLKLNSKDSYFQCLHLHTCRKLWYLLLQCGMDSAIVKSQGNEACVCSLSFYSNACQILSSFSLYL